MAGGKQENGKVNVLAAGRKTVAMFAGNIPNIIAIVFLSGLVLQFLPVRSLSAFLGGRYAG